MAASGKTVMAVIRASRPSFRNDSDKLAFTVHATFLASGYVLTATGRPAFSNSDLASSSSGLSHSIDAGPDEVAVDGWNDLEDQYAFVYVNPEKGSKKVLVKCLAINDSLVIDALGEDCADPVYADFDIKEYVAENGGTDYASQFKNLDKLVECLMSKILSKFDKSSSSPQERAPLQNVDVPPMQIDDPPSPSFPRMPIPAGIGSGDLLPGPGAGMYPSRDPFSGGGGMLLGPNDPSWFGGGGPSNFPRAPPGVPPGARFDPFGPPGVPGFEPDRFIRRPRRPGGGGIHPDLQHFGSDSSFI